jgi:hypothetical protein
MGRSPPIRSKKGYLKVATHPTFRWRRRRARSSAPKGTTPRRLARFLGSVSLSFGPVSLSPTRAHQRRRSQCVKAAETFCGLWCTRPTRKKSHGHPRNLKPCGLLCSPMAKVELEGEFSELHRACAVIRRCCGHGIIIVGERVNPLLGRSGGKEESYAGAILRYALSSQR